jgi:hypothetical protein
MVRGPTAEAAWVALLSYLVSQTRVLPLAGPQTHDECATGVAALLGGGGRKLSFATAVLLASALCIHSILEGMALGAQQVRARRGGRDSAGQVSLQGCRSCALCQCHAVSGMSCRRERHVVT